MLPTTAKLRWGVLGVAQNWDYAALVEAFNAGEGHAKGYRVATGGELAEAIRKAVANTQGPTLIECAIDRDDCTKELISWATLVISLSADG